MAATLPVRSKADGPSVPPTAPHGIDGIATAHAQLALLGEAIRLAAADLAAQPPQQPQPPLKQLSSSALGVGLATGGAAPPSVAAEPASTQTPLFIPTASQRLAALHDNLRRVHALMTEYEAVSLQAVEAHMRPSVQSAATEVTPGSGPAEDGSGATHSALSAAVASRARQPLPPSPSRRKASPPTRVYSLAKSNSLSGTADADAEAKKVATTQQQQQQQQQSVSGPALHQQRALASDATFSRFCELRVATDHLLLPWTVPTEKTSAFVSGCGGPSGVAGDDGDGAEHGNRPGSAGSSVSQGSTGSSHSQASTSLRMAQQQRQQTAATAHLNAYAHYFLDPTSPLRLPSLGDAEGGGVQADPVNGPGVLLKQMKDTQMQFEALQRCRLFNYELQLRQSATEQAPTAAAAAAKVKQIAAAPAAPDTPKWQHTTVMIERVSEVLAAIRPLFTVSSHYAYCGTPTVALGRQVHAWTQPLLRQLNELLSNPTLEDVDEDLREKLHRMKFDTEELQQAQAEAIADGDMQRSEELYYELAALAETTKAPYDEMEQLIGEYIEECVTFPTAALLDQKTTVTARLAKLIDEHAGRLTEVAQDMERIKEKRRAVIQSRHRQRSANSTYQHAWRAQWQTNGEQQMACYRAMEQLERRLAGLQSAQSLLADDWLQHMTLERQREEDAAAFSCFAEARTLALAETQKNLQAAVDGLRQYSGALQFTCDHAEAFARDVLEGHARDRQLALRKDRLEQFRTLYLTLGDLRFKKARNAEEIDKKIEYYTLQQEVAMDVSNPKAREYSQAKQQYEAAKAEALRQLHQIDERSRLQLEAFKPTEELLRRAGVDFVSPEEELAQRNMQRTQRLVEYQQLIEEGIGVREPQNKSAPVPLSISPASSAPTTLTVAAQATQGQHAATARDPFATEPRGSVADGGGGGGMRRLPAISGGSVNPGRPSISARPFTAGMHAPPPPPPPALPSPAIRREGGKSGTPPAVFAAHPFPSPPSSARVPMSGAVSQPTAAAPAAAEAFCLTESGGGGGGGGVARTLPPMEWSSTTAASSSPPPPLPLPPQLHSTEERIMRDISKTAALGGGGSGSGRGSLQPSKRKSTHLSL